MHKTIDRAIPEPYAKKQREKISRQEDQRDIRLVQSCSVADALRILEGQ